MSQPTPRENTGTGGPNLAKLEEAVLAFWQREKIFERSVNERPADKSFVFYDGPPYATGLPHVGTLLASIVKDTVPRYKTMKGYRVERRFGWDCHGLPIEVMVEKQLGLGSKKDIEKYGIAKFNEACRTTVLRYVEDWQRTINRLGRWVDFENDYKTMDATYMESAWWVFSELYKKGLVYEDFRSSLYCMRCETPLSKMETTMDDSYQDVEDPAVYVGFQLQGKPTTYFVAWTTTPWTISANVALAVKSDITYVAAKITKGDEAWIGRTLIFAESRLEKVLPEGSYEITQRYQGSELVGWRYNPVQDFMKPEGDAYRVIASDVVSSEEGTGVLHVAPAFGEDDFEMGKQEKLPTLLTIDDRGHFLPAITPWAGQFIKDADPSIIEALRTSGHLFKAETLTHSYPFCWRCHNKLIYKVQKSWYVKVQSIKKKLLATNEKIDWVPKHLQHGQFGKGVENAPDWGVSRSRYWGIPLPVWRCDRCKKERVIGSIDELQACSGKRPHDLHRPLIDEVAWACSCGGTYTRVVDVFDVWFDSGTMPYGQVHYPFENKETFEATFPADFITEYIPQTRGWFYVMHVLSNALFGKPAFKHVLTTGTILGSDGTKMSKSKGNMPDVNIIFDRYGSDALRLYLLQSAVMQGEAVAYEEEAIAEGMRKVLLPFLNVFSFFKLYAPAGEHLKPQRSPEHVLDRWILARLESTRAEVEKGMDQYEMTRAIRPLTEFVSDLSTWYLRRSRDRFKGEDEADKQAALTTLFSVLTTLTKIMAPFAPFLAEHLYQELKPWNAKPKDSVHLELWPRAHKEFMDEALLAEMTIARQVVELGHGKRSELKIKVRQPLLAVKVAGASSLAEAVRALVTAELNVMEWHDAKGEQLAADLDTTMTPALKREGLKREFVRQVNNLRKKQGLSISDQIKLTYLTTSQSLLELIDSETTALQRDVLAHSIEPGKGENELDVDGETIAITLHR